MTREEAINVIKGWVLTDKDREALETILPELKRDDRKRIKENCIHFLELQKSHHASTVEIDECIDWLNSLVPPKWLYRLEYKDETCGLWYNGEGKWCFEQGIGSLVGCKTKDLPMDHDERYKQGGRDWFSSCSNKEDLLHWYSLNDAEELIKKGFVFTRYLATEYHEYENETVFIKDSSLIREEIDIFELFGKTKPMFKEGDWLQYRNHEPFLVEDITEQGYVSGEECLPFEWENEIHLWTIKDAIPGDILEDKAGISIFKKINQGNIIEVYCTLYKDGDFIIDDEFCDEGILKPASREQRDRLFTRIKKSGYEWDEKAKKLVNSSLKEKEEIMSETDGWGKEDKENYKEILVHLMCQGNSATLDVNRKNWRKLESWFKRRVPAALSLGKKDKKMIEEIISDLRELRDNETNEELISDYERKIEWLKEKI